MQPAEAATILYQDNGMSIKITDLPSEATLSGSTIIYVVDPAGPTSYQSTLASVSNYMKGSLATTMVHAFAVDASGNLQYTQITDSNVQLQSGGKDLYSTVDVGTNQYSYSIDTSGNLIATYSY